MDAETLTLRLEVAAFAQAMEANLRKHDADRGRRGWAGDKPGPLLMRVYDEIDELAQEALKPTFDVAKVLSEAADVGAMSMMVADVCGGLNATPAPAPTAPTASCVHCGGVMAAALHCTRCGETEVSGPALAAAEAQPAPAQPAPDETSVRALADLLWDARWKGCPPGPLRQFASVALNPENTTAAAWDAMARAAYASIGGRAVALRGALRWAAEQIGCPRITGVVGHSALETHSCPVCAALALQPGPAEAAVRAVCDSLDKCSDLLDEIHGQARRGDLGAFEQTVCTTGAAEEMVNGAVSALAPFTARGGGGNG